MADTAPTSTTPSFVNTISSIGSTMGTISSTAGLVAKMGWFANLPGMGYALPGVGIATGGLGLFSGVFSMAQNGVSLGGIVSTGMSAAGIFMGGMGLGAALGASAAAGTAGATAGMAALSGEALAAAQASVAMGGSSSMMGGLIAALANPVVLIAIVVVIVVIAVLLAIFGPKPTAEEKGLIEGTKELPTIWNNGYMLAIPAGALILSMIPAMNATRTSTQPVAVSTQVLRDRLPQDSFGVNGNSLQAGQSVPYGVPMLILDANGNVTRVAIASRAGVDASGRARDQITFYDLNKKYVFASPKDPTNYIPMLIDGKMNPKAMASIQTQNSLLTSCLGGALTAAQCTTAVTLAAASNKDVDAVPVN